MRSLQELTNCKVMALEDAMTALGWAFNKNGEELTDIQCSCGNTDLQVSGFIGTERIICEECHKGVMDLVSPLPTGEGQCYIPTAAEFEVDVAERWIALTADGGVCEAETAGVENV